MTVTAVNVLLSLGVAALAVAVWKAVVMVIQIATSPLRNIPGPPNSNWVYGNLKEIFAAENSVLHEGWVAKYGNTIKYKGWLSVRIGPQVITTAGC